MSTLIKTAKSEEDVINEVQKSLRDPQETFEKFPIKRIRQACLLRIESYKMNKFIAGWFENQATGLIKINDSFAADVIESYLFATIHKNDSIRAIRFAVDSQTSSMEESSFSLHKCSKVVAGKLFNDRYPSIQYYDEMKEFLQSFFRDCLACLHYGYSEKQWHCAMRALQVFSETKDYVYLDMLQEIIASFKEGKMIPSMPTTIFAYDMHYTALLKTRDILDKAKLSAKT